MDNELNLTNTQIKNLQAARNDIIKHNADVGAGNREDVLKFEQALNASNGNRLNLQIQPNESKLDYYNRLRAIEKERSAPILYKQYADNVQTKTLKTNLNTLFDNAAFNAEILSKIPAEDKFIINKFFDEIVEAFLENYGYNNKTINAKQAADALKTFYSIIKNESLSKLQSNIRSLLSGKKMGEHSEEFDNEDAAATTINNAIRNQLAKRELLLKKNQKLQILLMQQPEVLYNHNIMKL